MKIETRAVHAGRHIDPATGAVTAPIHLSTTFERRPDGEYPRGFSYSREDNPNRHALEECLASLEGGKQALCFSSGLAVATALVQGLEPGDHIVAPDDVYWGLRKVIGEVFGKWGLETSYVDMTNIDDFHAALRPTTRLVWVETPSNPLMKITDLTAIAALARMAGPNIITVCDGTFATPVLQQPLDCGIDMVAHSTTKYISGHSDVIGGALITRHDNYLFERARKSQRYGGSVPSPFDCWLTLRGIDTLPWRVRAQSENAHAGGALPGGAPRGGKGALSGTGAPSGAQDRGPADVGVRRHALLPGARVARSGDGGGGALQALHPRHQPGRGAQPDRASRQHRRAEYADAAESAARLDRAGAHRRPDRRSGAGAGYNSCLKSVRPASDTRKP